MKMWKKNLHTKKAHSTSCELFFILEKGEEEALMTLLCKYVCASLGRDENLNARIFLPRNGRFYIFKIIFSEFHFDHEETWVGTQHERSNSLISLRILIAF
jgi:hypothetical protein